MKYLIAVFLSLICSSYMMGQEPDTSFVFTNLNDALLKPLSVYKLDLSKKGLKIFPLDLVQFRNLRFLNLNKNKLKNIPKEIGELRNLEVLDVSKNSLEEIAPELGFLKVLRVLVLSRNNLVSIPSAFGDLEKLESLDLWDNDLLPLPDEIAKLKSLKTLDLRGILFSEEEHSRIKTLLPDTKIFLSPSCNCKN